MNPVLSVRLIAAAALPLILAASLSPADPEKGEPVPVRVCSMPFLSWAPLFIADAEGYFEKHGVRVELVRMTRLSDALPALVQGRIDVVPGYLNPGCLNLMARGAEIRFVADKGYVDSTGCSYRGFLARRSLAESGRLDSLSQLRGLVIATEQTDISYHDIDCLLAAAGLTAEDVKIVSVPYVGKLDAFERGAIDVTTASEPWLTRIVDSGHAVLWRRLRDVEPGFQHSYILFGPTLLRRNREAGVRFLAAYLEALRRYNEGKTDRNVEIIAGKTGLDPDLVRRACWSPIRKSGLMDVESVLEYEEWALRGGLLDERVPVEGFWDPSLIEEARRRLEPAD
ncbi:MAG: ABC transporter substrate-binding protein [Candidatus Eisenbacteria bacterium]